MERRKKLLFIMVCFWFFLLILFLGMDSILMMFLGCLGCLLFSLWIMVRSFQKGASFEAIQPFPALSLLDEEQVGTMFCMFLESVPQGIFHEVLNHSDMDVMLKRAHKKLDTYFGQKHVCRISRNQFVVVKEFENEIGGNYDEQNAYLDRISNYVSLMLSTLITPVNKVALQVEPLTLGAASSGIRYQARCLDDLIELARFTMKIAQTEQRRYLVSDETIRARKLNNEECMEGFLKKDWESEFTPFFQPIIDSSTYKIIGMESLARWQLGRVRLLDAKIFKDLAYEMDCIERIDIIIIEKTFEAAEKLHKEGLVQPDFRIVINISATTLQTMTAQNLVDMVQKHGLKSENVELDIKDEVFSNYWLSRNIQEFKKCSMRVALDIFDRQAFDLEGLFFNQYDTIKLDYSRYAESEQGVSARDSRLYPSLVTIASENGVDILAKGIENQHQMASAKKHKVRYLQGNYFTPPIPFFTFQIFAKKYQDGLFQEEYHFA